MTKDPIAATHHARVQGIPNPLITRLKESERQAPSTAHQPHPAFAQATTSAPKNAFADLLPFCTTGLPLTETQAINLSDVAGSLKEMMLIALQARVDERVMAELQNVVGEQAAEGIVNFFGDEFEI